ncbi:MAG TPA: hypothetical protein H9915_02640 [Candidatus Gemmiger faecigallinarum]|nr:hypothetical protein [Candidatus Gemmiger faecigallinarum]
MAAALVGAAFFLVLYGVQVLDPTNVDWILNSGADPSQHYLGWALYRNSEIRLPYLGLSYATVYPYRVSVLYSDSIPLLALLFRPLATLLPARFQYLGWWGLVSFALQGLLAQKIAWRVSGAEERGAAVRVGTVATSILALLYPVLTVRMFAHTALAGNWLILLGLWLWLCCRGSAVRSCLWWGLAGILCVGVHQYYLPMVGICAVGYAVVRLMRRDGPAPALLPVASFCGCALAELFVLGAFSGNFANTDPSGWFVGADPLNLVVPGLYSTWEVDIFVGWGVLLAALLALAAGLVQCLRGRAGVLVALRSRLPWLVSGTLIGLLSLLAACSNTFVVGGISLGTLPLPTFLYNFWHTFANCGRLAWLAGYLLLVVASGLLLRFGRTVGLAGLVACIVVQVGWRAEFLTDKSAAFRDDTLYRSETPLQSEAWQQLADSGQFSHLMFASYDIDAPEYWPLVAWAAENGWTVNGFYLAHLQGDLLQRTIQGELNELESDALYVFLDGSQLQQSRLAGQLHFYRVDGVLLGSVVELPLPEADVQPVAADLSRCETDQEGNATVISAAGVSIAPGEMISTNEWTLQPGQYTVTLTGAGLDNSYIHSGFRNADGQWVEQEVVFLSGEPDRMVFQFTVGEPVIGWRVQIHTLGDAPVQVDGIAVSAVG